MRTVIYVATVIAAATGDARGDAWLVAEAPAAVAVSDAQEGVFRAGVMPAVGLYASNERVAVGVRVRAGILRNGPTPSNNLADPGAGGLGTVGVAMRFAKAGLWVEGVGGLGLTGHDVVPAVELGAGFSFPVGALDVGPSVRYARIIHREPMSLGTAELVLAGIDVRFGVDRAPRKRAVRAYVAAAPRAPGPPPPQAERDADAIALRETGCAEVLDGCPLSEDIVVRDSRIVLSERVLFDFDRVRVRSRGRAAVAQIARLWKAHPEWKHLTIEGHTDAQGDKAYNQHLSEKRAHKVREVLLANGCDPEAVDAVGFGQTRLRALGTDLDSHGLNRRVEFVIDQRVPRGDDK